MTNEKYKRAVKLHEQLAYLQSATYDSVCGYVRRDQYGNEFPEKTKDTELIERMTKAIRSVREDIERELEQL